MALLVLPLLLPLHFERRKNALLWLLQSESERAFTSVEGLLGQSPGRS